MFNPHPNLADEVNDAIIQSEIEGGVFLHDLPPATVLHIQTLHHCYTAVLLGGSDALGLRDFGAYFKLVEQNVDTAVALADRVIILDQGAKVFAGTPAQLTADEQIAIRYLGVGV